MQNESKSNEMGKGGAGAWFALIIIGLLSVMCFMDRTVISAVLEPLKKDLGLTDTQAGLLLTIYNLVVALMSVPMGMLVDRWSRKGVVGLMGIIWSVATFFTGLGRNFAGVLVPRLFVSLGEAGFASGGVALLTAHFPPKFRSRALGLYLMSIPIGTIAGFALGGYISANFGGWRVPFYYFAVPGIVLAIIAFFVKDYKTMKADHLSDTNVWHAFAYIFKIPSIKWIYMGAGFINFLGIAFLTWGPVLLMRTMHVNEAVAGGLSGLFAILGAIGTFVGGVIADKWYMKNPNARILVAMWAIPVNAVVSMTYIFSLSSGLITVGLIFGALHSFFGSMWLSALMTSIQEAVHPSTKGMAQSLSIFIYLLIAAPGAVLVGAISDAFGGGGTGLVYGLMLPCVVYLLAIPALLRACKFYEQDVNKVKDIPLEAA